MFLPSHLFVEDDPKELCCVGWLDYLLIHCDLSYILLLFGPCEVYQLSLLCSEQGPRSASPCLYAGDIFPLKYFLTKDNGNSVLIENPEFMIAVLKRVTAMNAELRAQNNTLVEQSNAQTVRRLIRR